MTKLWTTTQKTAKTIHSLSDISTQNTKLQNNTHSSSQKHTPNIHRQIYLKLQQKSIYQHYPQHLLL